MHGFPSFARFSGQWLARLIVLLGALLPLRAAATHALGSDMYYTNVGPGLYTVQYRLYRDCSGTTAPATFTLSYVGRSCGQSGTGTNAGGLLTLQAGTSSTANPYCRFTNLQSPCSATGPTTSSKPNYQIYAYSSLLNLGTSANAKCSEWRLSTTLSLRPDVENLEAEGSLYSFLHLNNREVPDDSSPVFSIYRGLQPLATMCDSAVIAYNAGVIDPDGDSLVYSLAPAYEDTPGSGTQGQVRYAPGFSATAPIRTLNGVPLALDPATGTITLRTDAHRPTPFQSADPNNKFVVVLQVEAYRRLPSGVVVRTAMVRRDLAVVVVDCLWSGRAPQAGVGEATTNGLPPAAIVPNGVVTAVLGQPFTLEIPFTDLEGDSIWVEADPASLLTGAQFAQGRLWYSGMPGSYTSASFTWTPLAMRAQPYVLHLVVRDNGCPVAAVARYAYPIQVLASRPTGLATSGVAPRLLVAPNPFTTEALLTLPLSGSATEVLICDATGRLVDRLAIRPNQSAVTWRPGPMLPIGLYYARWRGDGRPDSRAVVLQKQ